MPWVACVCALDVGHTSTYRKPLSCFGVLSPGSLQAKLCQQDSNLSTVHDHAFQMLVDAGGVSQSLWTMALVTIQNG